MYVSFYLTDYNHYRYILQDVAWRTGSVCTFAGIISTISSESSVLFMCLITIDRILVIRYPFGQFSFKKTNGLIAATISWLISSMIAVAPVVFKSHFKVTSQTYIFHCYKKCFLILLKLSTWSGYRFI